MLCCCHHVRLLGLSLLVLLEALAYAAVPSAPSASCEADTACQALVDEGIAHFGAGRFTEARQSFERAYAVRADPTILYNLARALHRDGKPREATRYYQSFLDAGAADNEIQRRKAEAFLSEAKKESEHPLLTSSTNQVAGPVYAAATAESTKDKLDVIVHDTVGGAKQRTDMRVERTADVIPDNRYSLPDSILAARPSVMFTGPSTDRAGPPVPSNPRWSLARIDTVVTLGVASVVALTIAAGLASLDGKPSSSLCMPSIIPALPYDPQQCIIRTLPGIGALFATGAVLGVATVTLGVVWPKSTKLRKNLQIERAAAVLEPDEAISKLP